MGIRATKSHNCGTLCNFNTCEGDVVSKHKVGVFLQLSVRKFRVKTTNN